MQVGQIFINDLPCETALWQTSRYITCNRVNDVVGAKNVTLYVNNQSNPAYVYDIEEKLVYTCKKDAYGAWLSPAHRCWNTECELLRFNSR